mgnify:CR=1 FL=1
MLMLVDGDADACVPYKGNEEWVDQIASKGVIATKKKWHPWCVHDTVFCCAAAVGSLLGQCSIEIDNNILLFIGTPKEWTTCPLATPPPTLSPTPNLTSRFVLRYVHFRNSTIPKD